MALHTNNVREGVSIGPHRDTVLRAKSLPQLDALRGLKWAIPLGLFCGSLVGLCAHAHRAEGTHPRWVIVLTITDSITNELLEQRELDPRLEYDDPVKCESIVAGVGPIPTSANLAAVLGCRKVERKDTASL